MTNDFREEAKAKDRRIMMELLGENAPSKNVGAAAAVEDESDEEEPTAAVNFRAKPVPEHTRQPVFQNMVREQPKR